eukprot:Partr_v1_DN27278_c0_g1_i1_m38949 putative NA
MTISREKKKQMSAWLHATAQRFPGLILLGFLTVAFLGPPFFPTVYWVVTLSVYTFLVTNSIRLATGLTVTAIKTKAHTETNWKRRYQECIKENESAEMPITYDEVNHVIVIPNYKEDMATLCETLDTLAAHSCATAKYKVVLAMEEGEKGCEEKAGKLISIFGSHFASMQFTVHPSGIPGEARGKSSNVAWAAVYYAKHWMKEENVRREIFTVMDADTHLTEKYFEFMTYKYATSTAAEQEKSLFAPVLVFDRNSNNVPFPARVADICWSIGLMANFIMPVRVPCSVYSVSILLARRVNYWDAGPEAIGEDFHMAMKCNTALRMDLRMLPVYIPASCSSVQGDSYWSSLYARFEQSKRHLWGLLDFGYCFARLITQKCWTHSFLKSFILQYILFEIFYQPFFGFYHLTGAMLFPASQTPFGLLVLDITFYIRIALIPSAIVVAIAYERYHYVSCKYRAACIEKNRQFTMQQYELSSSSSNLQVFDSASHSQVGFRKWYQPLDWAALPIALIFFYLIPAVNAMFWQMFTNKLDYKVSLKPSTRVNETIMDDGATTMEGADNDGSEIQLVVSGDVHGDGASVSSFLSANEHPHDGDDKAERNKRSSHIARDSGVELSRLANPMPADNIEVVVAAA